MQSLAHRIYEEHERRWSEGEPETIPPPTRIAQIDDVFETPHSPPIRPCITSTAFQEVEWRTQVSNQVIREEHESERGLARAGSCVDPLTRSASRIESWEQQALSPSPERSGTPPQQHKLLVGETPHVNVQDTNPPTTGVVQTQKTDSGPTNQQRPARASTHFRHSQRRHSSFGHALETGFELRRGSSITGTTTWQPQSVHYRVRGQSFVSTLSGASAFTGEVEVMNDDVPETKVSVPRPHPTVTTFQIKFPDDVMRSSSLYKINKHDDVDLLAPWRRRVFRFAPLATFLAMSSYFAYFGYRIFCTFSAQQKYHRTYVMAWIFICSEFMVAIPAFFHNSYALLAARGRVRAKLRLRGNIVPTIDVFVTCCKEDVDVIMDTVRAACVVDYPQSRFRVVVCDDGADPDLRAAVEELSLDYPYLYYHARIKVKGKPHHFKAGNLIAATEMTETLSGGGGEFIAALDADMIPEPDWLRCIIAHMVEDPGLGLVCPPQLFYNVPNSDPLVQSLDAFVHVMEPTKDANGVAWCTGSGYAIRRSALKAIGGWPTGSLAEDVYTSSKLLGAGWRTAFVHEALQFGTVPDTYTSHLKQRTRWTLGTLQTALKLRFCLYGSAIGKMTFLQRLSGFIFTIDAFFKIFLQIALLTIPIVLVSGRTLVAYADSHQLWWQTRLAFINLVLTRVHDFVAYIPSGYRLAQRDSGAQMWMAPYHSITILRSFILPSWLGGKPMAFSSSGSLKSELNERDISRRAPLHRRIITMVWGCDCYFHVAYVCFALTAVSLSISRAFQYTATNDRLVYLLTHAFWPPMLWLLCLTAYCVPIAYMLFPPTMPDREELLERDKKTGVARPKTYWKGQRWRKWGFWHETQYTICTLYTTGIFIISFIISGFHTGGIF